MIEKETFDMNNEQKIRNSKIFGNNIRRLRMNTGLTQEMVVSLLRKKGQTLSRSIYSQIECGTYSITVSELALLKEIFHTEYEEFFKDTQEEVVAALSSGANAYCLKDIDPEKLADVIRDVNNGVCWLDPLIAGYALNSIPKVDDSALIGEHANMHNQVPLTEREQEVLKHLVAGKSNTEIAKELIVSVHTAKAHVCSILQKMCVNDRVQAAVKAVKEGMV